MKKTETEMFKLWHEAAKDDNFVERRTEELTELAWSEWLGIKNEAGIEKYRELEPLGSIYGWRLSDVHIEWEGKDIDIASPLEWMHSPQWEDMQYEACREHMDDEKGEAKFNEDDEHEGLEADCKDCVEEIWFWWELYYEDVYGDFRDEIRPIVQAFKDKAVKKINKLKADIEKAIVGTNCDELPIELQVVMIESIMEDRKEAK